MFSRSALLLVVVCCWVLHGSAQELISVKTAGGPGYDWGKKVAVDASGNIIATGIFETGCLISGVPLVSYGGIDSYVVKLDEQGELLWSRHWGGLQSEYPGGLVLDEEDNIYISGYAQWTFQMMDTTFEADGETDAFLAKFDPEGALLWLNTIRGSGNASAKSLAYRSGHLIVGGTFDSTIVSQSDTIEAMGADDIYVASYDTDGALEWYHACGGMGDEFLADVATDADGRVYGTAWFDMDLSFGDTTLNTFGNRDIAVACWDPDGTTVWVRHIYSGGTDMCFAMDADNDGNTYTIGTFTGWTNMDGQYFSSYHDLMIVKLDPVGEVVWAKFADGWNNFIGQDVEVGSDQHVYVSARFQNSATFDGIPLNGSTPYQDKGVFLELDQSGALQWIVQSTGDGTCHPEGLFQAPNGSLLATGMVSGSVSFMDTVVQSVGSNDIFFLGLSSDGHIGYPEPLLTPEEDAFTVCSDNSQIVVVLNESCVSLSAWIELVDPMGRLLLSQGLQGSRTRLKPIIPTGLVLVRLTLGDRVLTRKFILK